MADLTIDASAVGNPDSLPVRVVIYLVDTRGIRTIGFDQPSQDLVVPFHGWTDDAGLLLVDVVANNRVVSPSGITGYAVYVDGHRFLIVKADIPETLEECVPLLPGSATGPPGATGPAGATGIGVDRSSWCDRRDRSRRRDGGRVDRCDRPEGRSRVGRRRCRLVDVDDGTGMGRRDNGRSRPRRQHPVPGTRRTRHGHRRRELRFTPPPT